MEQKSAQGDGAVKDQIRRLVQEQPFGVLCTQGRGRPYGSLVAIAAFDDLRSFLFATPRETTKYRLLSECRQVSLVIDSRASHPGDFMKIDALTASGAAEEISPGEGFEVLSGRLIERHPAQRAMIAAPTSALFRVDVTRYLYVARLQEVWEWLPEEGTFFERKA